MPRYDLSEGSSLLVDRVFSWGKIIPQKPFTLNNVIWDHEKYWLLMLPSYKYGPDVFRNGFTWAKAFIMWTNLRGLKWGYMSIGEVK